MAEENYYRSALRRCVDLYHKHGKRYMDFYERVSNLCASMKPGTEIVIDDWCVPERHDEFCDVVTLYECEQPWNDGEGLVYLSADRKRVVRSPVCFKNNRRPAVWCSNPSDSAPA